MTTMTIAPARRGRRPNPNTIRREPRRRRSQMVGAVTCSLADILFPVTMTDNPDWSNNEYSRLVIGTIEGRRKVLNYCSPIYGVYPNAEIFPKIEAILDAHNIRYEKYYSHIDNVRFYVEYRITDARYAYTMKGTNDTIQPTIRVHHSYNGKTKYRIVFGYFRVICTNGLTIAVEEMKRFNLCIVGKHTLAIKESFKKFDTMLNFFVAEAPLIISAITGKYEILGGRMVTKPEDRVKEVLNATKIRLVDNTKFNTLNYIMGKIKGEADDKKNGYNGKINDWLIYNGINQYINENSRNISAPEVRMETDTKVLEYMLENA